MSRLTNVPKRKLTIVVVVCMLIALIAGIILVLGGNSRKLSIKLNGEKSLKVKAEQVYKDKGATATLGDGWFKFQDKEVSVKAKGHVDTHKAGVYEIIYTAKCGNKKVSTTRKVKVLYDDKEPPVITLDGGENITVYQNIGWNDSYTATDNRDGDITKKVKVSGKVNMKKPGTYKIKYSVSDSSENKTTVTRTVTVKEKLENVPTEKVIYLTFDDGPGPYTDKLLDILKKYNVKASFFVTNLRSDFQGDIAREAKEGHTVGVHSYSHDYKKIYASEQAYWDDFDAMENVIVAQTGQSTRLMRLPGGSSNMVSKFNRGVMGRLTAQADQKGYIYFDWNVSSGDAGGTTNSNVVYQNVINGVKSHNQSVVLCHDVKGYTVDAIEPIIVWGLQNGYSFEPLNEASFTAHHHVQN